TTLQPCQAHFNSMTPTPQSLMSPQDAVEVTNKLLADARAAAGSPEVQRSTYTPVETLSKAIDALKGTEQEQELRTLFATMFSENDKLLDVIAARPDMSGDIAQNTNKQQGTLFFSQIHVTATSLDAAIQLYKEQRLKEYQRREVYIPPIAKASLQASDEDIFPLMENVEEFLRSGRQVMLLLGDSGAGETTFNRHLEKHLWDTYSAGDPIPLRIILPAIKEPGLDLVDKHLKASGFSDEHIHQLKLEKQEFVVLCDGYDESQLSTNLHTTNRLNQPGQWRVKMVICYRSECLGRGYYARFLPQVANHYDRTVQDFFQEAVIAPFSRRQIEDYV
ncbi:Transducin (beta)-like 1 X-linked receptor 1, partial [Linnemannia schmuckeri]